MATVRRQVVAELDDQELDELSSLGALLSGDNLLKDVDGDADYVLTGAQLAMLEVEGGAAVSEPGQQLEDVDVEYGQQIVQIGSGRSRFTAKLADDTGDHEKVYVYDSDGERWPVKRANILYYRSKGFHLRPPRGLDAPRADFTCRSTMRPHNKVFRTKMDAEDHFRAMHEREYRAETEERELMKEGRLDALLEQLVAKQGSGSNVESAQLVRLMTELLAEQKKEKVNAN